MQYCPVASSSASSSIICIWLSRSWLPAEAEKARQRQQAAAWPAGRLTLFLCRGESKLKAPSKEPSGARTSASEPLCGCDPRCQASWSHHHDLIVELLGLHVKGSEGGSLCPSFLTAQGGAKFRRRWGRDVQSRPVAQRPVGPPRS